MKDEGASAAAVSRGNRRRGRKSIGAAIKEAGSKPAPKRQTPKPGARSTGKTIKQTGRRLPQIFKPGGGSGRPSPSSAPTGGRNVFTTRPPRSSFTTQRQAARARVRQTRSEAVEDGRMAPLLRLPRRPVLEGGYTEAQRQDIIDSTEETIQDATRSRQTAREKLSLVNSLDESDGPSELRRLGDRETRRALNKYIGATDTRKAGVVDELGGEEAEGLTRQQKIDLFRGAEREQLDAAAEAKPGRQKFEIQAAGVNVPVEAGVKGFIDQASGGVSPNVRKALNLSYIVPTQTVRATVEDPLKAIGTNARFARDTALGLFTTPASMIVDAAQGKPIADIAKDTGKSVVDEYEQFYGPAAQGNAAGFRENVSESGGILRVGLDAATLATPVGKAAGVTAKGMGMPIVTKPRADLRYSLGDDAVRAQRTESAKAMPNLFRAVAQQGVDDLRRGTEDRRVRRARRSARGESTRGDRLAQMFGAKTTMPVVRARGGTRRPDGGEVAPIFRSSLFRMGKRSVAKRKNQAVDEIRETQQALINDAQEATKGLSDRETAAWGYLHRGLAGAGDDVDTVAQLQRRRQQIVDNRKEANYSPGLFRLQRDELRVIDDLLDNVDEAFSPRAVAAAERTRAIERESAKIDPDLPEARAELRRYAQQAATVGVQRDVLTEAELKAARATIHADARKQVDRARRDYQAALVEAGVAQGRAEVLSRNVGGRAAEDMAVRAGNPRARKDGTYAGGGIGAAAGKKAVQEALEALEDAVAVEKQARTARSKKRIAEDAAAARETDAEYLARVRAVAQAEGLPEPGYIPSRALFQARLSDSTAGGASAVRGHGRYKGDAFALGKEQISPAVFHQGLRRNVKLNVNWRLVADQFEEHAHPKLRDMPVRELLEKADKMGLDEGEFGVYMPGRLRKNAAKHADDDNVLDDVAGSDMEMPTGMERAVGDSTMASLGELRAALEAGELQATTKASLVARGPFDEILSTTHPQGVLARGANIARAKASRTLFAFNPVWFAANTLGAAVPSVMRGVSPKSFVSAQLYFRGLHKRDPAAHTALRRELGIGHQRLQDVQQPRMGGAADNPKISIPVVSGTFAGMVRGWQAYRNTPMGAKVRPLSKSIDAWLGLEQKVNSDAFRRSLLYTEARREAFRRIDAEAGVANAVMERLQAVVRPSGASPRLQTKIDEIVNSRKDIETLGHKTSNILGDWQTFTATERTAMGLIFLYPYLRYSLKFLFSTMPVHHPVMLNIMAQLAQLNAREIKDVLHGEELPYQMGKVYFTRDGKVQEIEVGKINPGGNTITEAKGLDAVLGLLPPWYQMGLDQVLERNTFAGRDWQFEGYPALSKEKPEHASLEVHGRIALRDLLEMFPPTREWSRQKLTGFQGDDSLPWDTRPIKYKSDELKKIAAQVKREQDSGEWWEKVMRHQLFLVPKPSRDPAAAKARAEKNDDKPAPKKSGSWGIGGSGGWGVGG